MKKWVIRPGDLVALKKYCQDKYKYHEHRQKYFQHNYIYNREKLKKWMIRPGDSVALKVVSVYYATVKGNSLQFLIILMMLLL